MIRVDSLTKKWPVIPLGECVDFLDHLRRPVKSEHRKEGVYPYYGANGQQGTIDGYIFDEELILLAEDGGFFGQKGRHIAYRISGKSWVNNHAHVLRPKKNFNIEFLFRVLECYDVTPFITGTTRAKLNKSDAARIPIPAPPLAEQRRIAAILDKADAIRRKRQEALKLVDDLVKSQFIEMFGEWNELNRWPCAQVSEIAEVTVGVVIKPAQYYTDLPNGIRTFRSLNVGEMRVRDDDWVYFTPEGHKANSKSELRSGDVLVVRSGYPGTSCVITSEYAGSNAIDVIIARPDIKSMNPVYLCAFTNFTHGKYQIRAKTGGAAQQHFNVGAYKDMTISVPPLSLQNQFAALVELADKSKFAMQRQLSEIETLSSALKQEFFA